MKIFVINLPKDKERKESIQHQADKLGLNVEFIEAVNGKDLSEDEINILSKDFHQHGMTHGVLGCSLSHIKIYEKMIKDNIDIALILEDDALLNENIIESYNLIENYNYKNKHKPNVYLLSVVNEYIDTFKTKLSTKYNLVNVIDADYTYGYMLNIKAANNLLNFLTPVWIEADKWRFMREHGAIKLKAIIPHVIDVTPLSAVSTLESDRSITLEKRIAFFNEQYKNRSLYVKLRAFLWRIFVRSWVKRIKI
ncbi:glycosyltransferase 25 family protein [Proteus vulgaris]|uniref:glycosyltransferase family 25 protein n=1 Tax=Proteus vulgaris TaxID=585 RepID=UPI0004FF9807|nr:glycosyltransferase family 25 protein [Proteus vulgaris]KGA60058.1 glycosyltransferase 25 family protein [Proteus vulgaris]